MKLKTALLSALAGSAALAAPAFADNGWHHGYGHSRSHFAPAHPAFVMPAPRVVYTPAPVYYRPAPRVVYAPAPVYYRPAPVYSAPVVVSPGISIRFNLPL